MTLSSKTAALGLVSAIALSVGRAEAAPCMEVILTGTGTPVPFANKGVARAGAGTLVRYGDTTDKCNLLRLQFDAGRGTALRLSQVGVIAPRLNAVLLTHIHSDHTTDLPDLIETRWILVKKDRFYKPLTVVTTMGAGEQLVRNATGAWKDEIELRRIQDRRKRRPEVDIRAFKPTNEPQEVLRYGRIIVTAIAVPHIQNSVAYRVDTPAGSVVISGDTSVTPNIRKLAKGADVVVHEVVLPGISPPLPKRIYKGHANATTLGAMMKGIYDADRKTPQLLLTHLIPAPGANRQGPFKFGRTITEKDYLDAVRKGGFKGQVIVGKDLTKVRIVGKY